MKKLFLLLLPLLMLLGCGEQRPIRVGFIGGLSERNADVGQAGEQAVILAVEQINRAGGIKGRLVEMISRDDAQNADTARKVAEELAAAKVDAVIGPFTSGVAAATVPVLDKAGIVTISPTITSMDFYGKDDHLIRVNRTTRDNAQEYAAVIYGRGQRQLSIAYDLRNKSFTESWLNEFVKAYSAQGGVVVAKVPYTSAADSDFSVVVGDMLKAKPDGLFFISGAIDVARLAQQARRLAPGLPLGCSEWAGSEQLIKLGGKMVEGLLVVQNFNRDDQSPRYLAFRDAFQERFHRLPGYSSVLAYDAASVLFDALRQKQPSENLKTAILRLGAYEGLQQPIKFDANGDSERKVFFTEIRDGSFKIVQ